MNRYKYCIILLVVALGFSCNEDVKLEGVRLSPASLTMREGSEPQQIYLYLYPSYTTETKVRWVSEDENIANVDSEGLVTPVNPGKTFVSVYSGERKLASCDVTVTPFIHATGISLDSDNISCLLGATGLKLTATILPQDASNQTVLWSSDTPGVVSVDGLGNLTTVSVGNATITATTADGGFTASCLVTVTYEYVTGVTVSPTTLTIYVNSAATTLTAEVIPATASNPAVTWSSSDQGVVQVDNQGNLTAIAAGTATVTATTDEGGFTATCTVTVEAAITKGPNLLVNPGFEEPDDNSDNLTVGWEQVPEEWFIAYYGADAGIAPTPANRAQKANFYTSGNGAAMAEICTGKYTVRFPMNNANGIYQIVNVEPGATYFFSIDIGIIMWNTAIMSTRGIDAVKVLSVDGMTTYCLAPISATFTDETRPVGILRELSGTFVVPEGVTQVRFQMDKRHFVSPDAAPLVGIDETVFCKVQ